VPPEHLRAAVAALDAADIARARWFGGKGAAVGAIDLAGALGPFDDEWLLALRLGADTYLAPARVDGGWIAEAEGPLWRALASACLEGATVGGDRLRLRGAAGPVPTETTGEAVRPLGIDQSNTSVVLGERLVLKCYRRLAPGEHPELELTRYLSARGLECLPAVHGSATVEVADVRAGALLLQTFVAAGRDGWLAAEEEVGALLDAGDDAAARRAPERWAPAVGRAAAEVHAALAAATEPAFEPRTARRAELTGLERAAVAQLDEALAVLDEPVRGELAAAAPGLRRRFALFADAGPALLTRVHGDLHLGQFLHRPGTGPALVDFEGEPTKSTDERRRHASPLRDLAGLLRSVDHAAHWTCHVRAEPAGPVALAWIAAARTGIRSGYERRLAELNAPFRVDPRLLAAFEAEKAVYEFLYAVRFLPSWLEVPRRALASAVA
jgi:maltokinase